MKNRFDDRCVAAATSGDHRRKACVTCRRAWAIAFKMAVMAPESNGPYNVIVMNMQMVPT